MEYLALFSHLAKTILYSEDGITDQVRKLVVQLRNGGNTDFANTLNNCLEDPTLDRKVKLNLLRSMLASIGLMSFQNQSLSQLATTIEDADRLIPDYMPGMGLLPRKLQLALQGILGDKLYEKDAEKAYVGHNMVVIFKDEHVLFQPIRQVLGITLKQPTVGDLRKMIAQHANAYP